MNWKSNTFVIALCFLSFWPMWGLTRVVRADNTTVYVRPDGSIDPPTAPISSIDNITYTLTGDLTYPAYSGISIQRSNIAIDGNGYAIQGFNQSGTGISINGINNVTIKSTDVEGFLVGVYISGSNNNLNGNNITNNGNGIHLYSSSKSIITMNNIERNSFSGILLEYSYDSNIICKNAFFFDGLTVWASWDNSVVDNLVNGKPLLYLENVSNYTIDVNAGQVVLVNCNQINVKNLTLSHTTFGIDLWNTVGSSISGCVMTSNVYGIYLAESSNNSVSKNNITANYYHGIFLESSSANVLDENSITANNDDGVVFMDDSSSNIVRGNSIVSNGNYGILLESANNWIYQNNFVNNTHQAGSLLPGLANTWDNGYPNGNYWANYNGTDSHEGPFQNLSGSDGVGDTPFLVVANNTDYYPLMGMISDFYISEGADFELVSNSTISDFQFNGTTILFNVSGVNATTGFCSIRVPSAILNGTLRVLVNDTQVQFSLLPISNNTNVVIYFTYSQSTEKIIISRVPEISSFPLILLFLLTILLILHTKKEDGSASRAHFVILRRKARKCRTDNSGAHACS